MTNPSSELRGLRQREMRTVVVKPAKRETLGLGPQSPPGQPQPLKEAIDGYYKG